MHNVKEHKVESSWDNGNAEEELIDGAAFVSSFKCALRSYFGL